MRERNHSNDIISDRALEMIMVDVLDGMLESSLESGILNGSRQATQLSLVNTRVGENRYFPSSAEKQSAAKMKKRIP